MKRFHNSIQEDNQLVAVYESDFKRQEDAVIEVLRRVKKAAWFEVQGCLEWMNEGSLKRALTNLKTEGKLKIDTDKGNMVLSPSGKPCHRYILIESHG